MALVGAQMAMAGGGNMALASGRMALASGSNGVGFGVGASQVTLQRAKTAREAIDTIAGKQKKTRHLL